IQDDRGRIVEIVNNYSKISFDFGPTLLSWLEVHAPAVYRAVIQADLESRDFFSGHGAALAHVYNHVLMPLANRRDKTTQTAWGIEDFKRRFGRMPEGMWLPETAVDLESLDILAEFGIKFTILAPHQAAGLRRLKGGTWRKILGARIDPTRAYQFNLASGRKIHVFFYNGPLSRAVAFERLLSDGGHFARRLMGCLNFKRKRHQLAHIATDGETFGHHFTFGDMALAYALRSIQSDPSVRLCNYGQYLEKHPPVHEVQISENTSWSCAHGVERWRSDCGCSSGSHPGWKQAWRAPLREALDWLRDETAPRFERKAGEIFKDPWAARNDYIRVVLDRSTRNVDRFLEDHALRPLEENEKILALKLLEMQRHAMLMYTSCGWFFDDISGIETVQVIMYAGRVVQLAQELFGDSIEQGFLERLEKAGGNSAKYRDGRAIYDKLVRPAMVDLRKVGAHYAVNSLFDGHDEHAGVYCYGVEREDYKLLPAGKARLALGRARVTSKITGESERISFGILHLGDHNLSGGTLTFQGEEAYAAFVAELTEAFARTDLPEVLRGMDKHFGAGAYSLKLLFRDEQRKILDLILKSTLAESEAVYRQLYENRAPLMRFLSDLGLPMPKGLLAAAEIALNTALRDALEGENPDADRIHPLLEEAKKLKIHLDGAGLGYTLKGTLEHLAESLRASPSELAPLKKLNKVAGLADIPIFQFSLWNTQNIFYAVLKDFYPQMRQKAESGDDAAREWASIFRAVGEKLKVRVEP
ncbi:MAG: DUF3536 domain-containing protein, partial [Elusimicrobia bacterium]|nr:DUF3536 domain-containing protein [Elusimicrobiota bacterium]